uniref:Uncharacterized protein n=1 Tax=Anguilla anguilla TaxID=7936 RepID=A0A0E9UTK1_ANGAN
MPKCLSFKPWLQNSIAVGDSF